MKMEFLKFFAYFFSVESFFLFPFYWPQGEKNAKKIGE